jgi:hypothetical protein
MIGAARDPLAGEARCPAVAWRRPPEPTPLHCAIARGLMGPRVGLDLHEAAQHLGVMPRDLDRALWREITRGT